MDRLVKQKIEIENQIRYKQELRKQHEIHLNKLEDHIISERKKEKDLYDEIYQIKTDVQIKEAQLMILKNTIKKYKEKKKEKLESKYKIKYIGILEKVNDLTFSVDMTFNLVFDNLQKLINKSTPFYILNRRLKDLREKYKNDLKEFIKDEIYRNSEKMADLQDLSFNISFLLKYEVYFQEDFFCEIMYAKIYDGFSYHFLMERETNRLDKPEWFFKYLIEKLDENNRIFKLYNISAKNCTYKIEKYILEKLNLLIEEKFDFLFHSNSPQKRNLVLHFVRELKNFRLETGKKYEVHIQDKKIIDMLMKMEKDNMDMKIEKIHLGDYKRWFSEYKSIYKEIRDLYGPLVCLDSDMLTVLVQHITDNLYVYCESSINHMRYISKDEINFLCQIYSEIENIKEFITVQENEYCFENSISLENENVNLSKISKFNSENIKLIKRLAVNETELICKNFRNFKYISDKNVVWITMEIVNLVSRYKKFMDHSFSVVEKTIGEYIDSYLINKIILITRFDSNDFYRFKEFFEGIKDHFKYYKSWKTVIGCKCIEDIFNGRRTYDDEETLFSLILKNYIE